MVARRGRRVRHRPHLEPASEPRHGAEHGESRGFIATLLVLALMGLVLDALGGFTFDAFRVAWLVQYPFWAVATVGVLVTRRKARRMLAAEGVSPRPLREILASARRR